MRNDKASDELRRDAHRRRVLAHLENAARDGLEPCPEVAQLKAPLIGEARLPESSTKPRRPAKAKPRRHKPAQLDLGV